MKRRRFILGIAGITLLDIAIIVLLLCINPKLKRIVDSTLLVDQFCITETTTVEFQESGKLMVFREGTYDFSNKAEPYIYSTINQAGKDSIGVKRYLTYQNNSVYLIHGATPKKTTYEANSILGFLGIDKILEAAKNYKLKNSITYLMETNLEAVYDMLLLDLYIEEEKVNSNNADIALEIEDKQIKSINITFSDLANELNYKAITKTITFKEYKNEEKIYPNIVPLEAIDLGFDKGETLEMYVIEMNEQYGDSILFKSGNFEMLIDAGTSSDGRNVNEIVSEKVSDGILEVVIATHHHADHTGGFNYALDGIENVGFFLDYGYRYSASAYMSQLSKYRSKGARYCSAYDSVNGKNGCSNIYTLDDNFSIKVLDTGQYLDSTVKNPSDNPNAQSVAIILTYGEITYYLAGDLAEEGEANLIEGNQIEEEITVYKASHHGSASHGSNSQKFLNLVNPKIAVISAAIYRQDLSEQNHPSEMTIQRLLETKYLQESKNVYLNATMGTIKLETDGNSLPTVSGFGAKRGYMVAGQKVLGENNLRYVDTKMYSIRNG